MRHTIVKAPRALSAVALVLLAPLLACGGAAPVPSAPPPAAPAGAPEAAPPPAAARPEPPVAPGGVLLDTVRAGRFDNGKMWTFEFPPLDYLREAYGLAPDAAWFERARLGALRIPNCSASFVSPSGLVMTNHHCAREAVTAVSGPGEALLDGGFYAARLEDERAVEELHADQLVEILDVTDEVRAALEGITDEEERSRVREETTDAIAERMAADRGGEEAGAVVEVISLYDGARHSAYVFRRYGDVRLVLAPELSLGFYGGDPDNFTFPRYNLDVAFLRVYDETTGEPFRTASYFAWSGEGVRPGDLVFVVGNPGSTSRLQTVAQLEFRRDVQDRGILDFVSSRAQVIADFIEAWPDEAEEHDLRNTLFSLRNSQKAYAGMVDGLHDPVILARRGDAERGFREGLEGDPDLRATYGGHLDRMAALQERKRALAAEYGAFLALTSPEYESATLRRGVFAFQYRLLRRRGIPDEALEGLRDALLAIGDQPAALDEALLEARLLDFARHFGDESEVVRAALEGRTPEGAAAVVVSGTALSDSAAVARAMQGGLPEDDPALALAGAFMERFVSFQQALSGILAAEEEVASGLGRARFELYGTEVPPDATFSLRLADGVVGGYPYNGTRAPHVTTFHGLYDRYHSFAGEPEWALPDRWLPVPTGLELSTPLNFVSTADIIGGNSGSPVLDRDLRVVGVVFDGNIESLSGDYIYLPERARAVAVDARGVLAALEHVYRADRIVGELLEGMPTPAGGSGAAGSTR